MELFKKYKSLITESTSHLNEVFDKPYELTRVDIPKEELDHIHTNGGVTDYSEHEIHDGRNDGTKKSILTTYKRNGAYEIHHELPSGVSGELVTTGKPNPRFVSTMFHHAKSLIDSGHSVRIVGHKDNGMFDHYHRIGKALARKYGYIISQPASHTDNSSSLVAKEYKTFDVSLAHESVIISNGSRSGPLFEFHLIKTYSGNLHGK